MPLIARVCQRRLSKQFFRLSLLMVMRVRFHVFLFLVHSSRYSFVELSNHSMVVKQWVRASESPFRKALSVFISCSCCSSQSRIFRIVPLTTQHSPLMQFSISGASFQQCRISLRLAPASTQNLVIVVVVVATIVATEIGSVIAAIQCTQGQSE